MSTPQTSVNPRAFVISRESLAPRDSVAPRASIKLTARGRVVVALAAAFLSLLGWITWGGGTADASAKPSGTVTQYVVVQPGESLWAIAADIAPSKDPREVILRMRELNNLGTDHVYPGQALVVPAF